MTPLSAFADRRPLGPAPPPARAIAAGRQMLLTTFRRTGARVPTPVWTVAVSDGRVGMWTADGLGKVKRLRHDPHVTIQACDLQGGTRPSDPVVEGTAEVVRAGPLYDEVRASMRRKYGWQVPVVRRMCHLTGLIGPAQTYGDTVVLIAVTDGPRRSVPRQLSDETRQS